MDVSGDQDGDHEVHRPVVAVVGGGMAGLAAAWELVAGTGGGDGSGPRVVVLEAGSRPGGKVRATEFCGRSVDLAADAFLARRPEATGLCTELGLDGDLVAPGAAGAALWSRGRLRMMPDGVNLGVPTRWWPLFRSGILSPEGSLRAALDLVRPHRGEPDATGDRAVGPVVAARLGHEVVERLVDPLVGGIHAGGVDELSAEATFPPLLVADRQPGSLMRALGRPPAGAPSPSNTPAQPPSPPTPVFWSLAGGTARLPAELTSSLAARGVTVHTGVAVESLSRAPAGGPDRRTWLLTLAGETAPVPGAVGSSDSQRVLAVDGVVLAVPAGQASVLLAGHATVAASLLGDIEHSSVTVVTLSMPAGSVRSELVGTGFLVPRTSTIDGRPPLITGCTYLSRKWPGLARPDDELIRLSVGRFGDDRPASLDDDELTAAAFGELSGILDIGGGPRQSVVTRWDGAFPQYTVGHLARTARIERSVAELPGVGVAGAAYRGVGIPAVVGSGRTAARAVLRSLDGAVPPPAGR
ncbi:MAG: protoporphyrinogen oxidase [Acidimicrobiales bacterium]|jgi:oxygen-dependent protoporphyrinogen oxidase